MNDAPRRVEGDAAGAEAVDQFQQKSSTASPTPLQSSKLNDLACQFLRLILPDTGPYVGYIVEATRKYNKFAFTIEELAEIIIAADAKGHTAYHACAAYKEAKHNLKGTPPAERLYGRTKRNVRGAKALWLDVDAGPGKPYPDAETAWHAITAFCNATGLPIPPAVLSGFGLHAYWPLSLMLDPETWGRYARGLQSLCVKYGLHVDPARTADIASVLRTPGTHHRKAGIREVRCGPLVGPFQLELFQILLDHSEPHAPKRSNNKIVDLLGEPPEYITSRPPRNVLEDSRVGLEDFAAAYSEPIAEHCKQVRQLRDEQGKLTEPRWYAGLGVLAFCEDGEKFGHKWSSGDPRYTQEETQEKLDRARQFGPTTCAKFHELNSAVCERCPWWGKIKSPIVLGHDRIQTECDDKGGLGEEFHHAQGQYDQTHQQGQYEQTKNQQGQADQTGRTQDDSAQPGRKVSATPFEAFDFAKIPPRQWLYGRHYVRKYVTATVAPGGSAKTASKLAEAGSMAVGRDLVDGSKPIERLRVWYWNGEDPRGEIDRRIAAVCLHYKVDPRELEGWLYVDSGHDMPICLATEARGVVRFNKEVINAINETIEQNKIDVVIIDPFISIHRVSENNNPLIDQVVKILGKIAAQNDCGIEIVHHVRKPAAGQQEITADDTRGGGAIVNAVRSCQVLNRMSRKEAEQARIEPDERFRYFRVDSGKQNLAPPEKAKWRFLESVDLPNGDNVQVVEFWQFPEAMNAVTQDEMEFVQATVREGIYNRWDTRAKFWIGRPLADWLGLDAQNKADREDIKEKLNACRRAGMIALETRVDERRRPREFVVAGPGGDKGGRGPRPDLAQQQGGGGAQQ